MQFETMWWRYLIVAICSYLVGNFNSAITISKFKKSDIRAMGSGNPGTMNMSRNFGLKIGLLVFTLDVLKGIIPTLVSGIVFSFFKDQFAFQPVVELARLVAAFFAVLGHVFPIFYGFKGGKGIATTIGALFICEWYFILICGACALAYIFATKMGAMGSFIATAPTAIFASIRLYYAYYLPALSTGISIGYYVLCNVFLMAIIFLTWFAHRENIKRLMWGEEHDTNWLQMIKDAKLKSKYKKQKSSK